MPESKRIALDYERCILFWADCLQLLKTMEDSSVDSVVTDPPYELKFLKWDKDGIAFKVELWREILRVLKPGGHLVSFGGARTMHRVTCAVEDAGFEIRDSLAWIYATGFPKKKTQLKPAIEPIVLAKKMIDCTLLSENEKRWGTGYLNVDQNRVGDQRVQTIMRSNTKSDSHTTAAWYGEGSGKILKGNWPANVILDETVLGKLGLEGLERIFYCTKPSRREKGDWNRHPTVKPLALMRHLVRLVTPKRGTVLDPFLGSGTTAMACALEGFQCIGIDKEHEYLRISRRRVMEIVRYGRKAFDKAEAVSGKAKTQRADVAVGRGKGGIRVGRGSKDRAFRAQRRVVGRSQEANESARLRDAEYPSSAWCESAVRALNSFHESLQVDGG